MVLLRQALKHEMYDTCSICAGLLSKGLCVSIISTSSVGSLVSHITTGTSHPPFPVMQHREILLIRSLEFRVALWFNPYRVPASKRMGSTQRAIRSLRFSRSALRVELQRFQVPFQPDDLSLSRIHYHTVMRFLVRQLSRFV